MCHHPTKGEKIQHSSFRGLTHRQAESPWSILRGNWKEKGRTSPCLVGITEKRYYFLCFHHIIVPTLLFVDPPVAYDLPR